ncbi:MAG: flagellar hook-length control protein FliK [Spirochaetes bacterium]|nr:flagellar hook-length control protein FliK [Spirochaetota bacterium]
MSQDPRDGRFPSDTRREDRDFGRADARDLPAETERSVEKKEAKAETPAADGSAAKAEGENLLALLLQRAAADGRMAPGRVEKAGELPRGKEESNVAEKGKKKDLPQGANLEALHGQTTPKLTADARIAGREALPPELAAPKNPDARASLLNRTGSEKGVHAPAVHGADKSTHKAPVSKPGAHGHTDGADKLGAKDEAAPAKKKEMPKGKFESLATVSNQAAPDVNPTAKQAEGQAVAEKPASGSDAARSERSELAGSGFKAHLPGTGKAGEIAHVRMPHPAEFVQTVSGQIRMAVAEGRETLTVKLQPENLGKMTISLGRDEGGVLTGKLTVETEAVKQLLESHLSDLKDHLEYAGFHFQALDVDVKSGTSHRGSEQAQRGENQESHGVTVDARAPEAAWARVDFRYTDRLMNVLA